MIAPLSYYCALSLGSAGPTVKPGMAVPSSQVSTVPSVSRWYSKHCQTSVERAVDEAMPFVEKSGRVASLDITGRDRSSAKENISPIAASFVDSRNSFHYGL